MGINKLIRYCLAIIIIGVPLVFIPEIAQSYELPKAILFRTFTLIIGGLLLFKTMLSHQFSFTQIKRENKFFWIALISYILILPLSTIFSIFPHLSFWGTFGRGQGLFQFLHYILFFLCLLTLDKKNTKDLINLLCYGALATSIIALSQQFSTLRIFGTIGQPDFLASYLLITLPFCFFNWSEETQSSNKKYFWFTSSLLILLTIILTTSRSAILGLIAGLILFSIIKGQKKLLLIPAALCLITIFLNIFSSTLQIEKDIFLSRFLIHGETFKSAEIRLKIWPKTIKEIISKPLLGYGPETLSEVFPQFDKEKVDRAHNEILDTAFSSGILGLISYMGLLLSIFIICIKNRKNNLLLASLISLVSLFITNMFSFSTTAHYVFWWLIIGIIINNTSDKKNYSIRISKLKSVIITLIAFALIALSITTNLLSISADFKYQEGLKAMIKLEHLQASNYFLEATKLNPKEAQYSIMGAKHALLVSENATSEIKEVFLQKAKAFTNRAENLVGKQFKEIRELKKELFL
ncbi:O-antigen ligase family protein [Candidatus Gracilibacteria bacterium]|nr:O-antigen ligase family protein [Candidatus Gracilibacteria bacterium]